MPQSAEKVLDHAPLFREPEYRKMLAEKKRNFERPYPDRTVTDQREFTKTWHYREVNLAREALVVNPAKACQPLGAVLRRPGLSEQCRLCMAVKGALLITVRTCRAISRSRRQRSHLR